MSADNWRACPRCAAAKKAEAANIEEKAKKSYGKVSAEKFVELLEEAKALVAKAEAFEDVESNHTFREDYQIGTSIDGVFSVSYSGSCNACGYSTQHSHKQAFPLEK